MKHLQGWPTAETQEQDLETGNLERVVYLIYTTFRDGTLRTELIWQTLIFLTNRNSDYRDVGLIKVLLKTVSLLIKRRLGAAVTYHDTLYRFRFFLASSMLSSVRF